MIDNKITDNNLDDGGVVFDSASGISVEEQREILSRINGIAEKNRRALCDGASENPDAKSKRKVVNAKKRGALFPVIINIAAVVILVAGGAALLFFNSRKDISIRQGSGVYTDTERALIEEIRRETAVMLEAKENEITSIALRLADVDARLSQLYSGNQDLSAEQTALEETLLAAQNSYRTDLSALQDERARILEDSRLREAALRALLEERAGEAAAAGITAGELDWARGELERLTGEQERIAVIDAQIAGGLTNVNALVQRGEYDQAHRVIQELRNFLDAGAWGEAARGASRSFRTRQEIYNQAITSMEATIAEMIRFRGINSEGLELYERTVQMEETIADMQRRLDAFSAGSSGQALRLNELEETAASLRAANTALTASNAEKDRTIQSLETEKTELVQTVNVRDNTIIARNNTISELQAANSTQQQEITNLRNQLATIRQLLQE